MDKIYMWIAWKLPRRLVYWAQIRVTCYATQEKYSSQIVPDLTAMDASRRWGEEFGE